VSGGVDAHCQAGHDHDLVAHELSCQPRSPTEPVLGSLSGTDDCHSAGTAEKARVARNEELPGTVPPLGFAERTHEILKGDGAADDGLYSGHGALLL
jgi:hypothetical protein